jgi:hypothetical protein
MDGGISPTLSLSRLGIDLALASELMHEVWCGEAALKSSFPKGYLIVHDKEALVLNSWDPLALLFIRTCVS